MFYLLTMVKNENLLWENKGSRLYKVEVFFFNSSFWFRGGGIYAGGVW